MAAFFCVLQIKFHEQDLVVRIFIVRRYQAEAVRSVEFQGFCHFRRVGIETHFLVTDLFRVSDQCFDQNLSKAVAPKTRADKKAFHLANSIADRPEGDHTSRFAGIGIRYQKPSVWCGVAAGKGAHLFLKTLKTKVEPEPRLIFAKEFPRFAYLIRIFGVNYIEHVLDIRIALKRSASSAEMSRARVHERFRFSYTEVMELAVEKYKVASEPFYLPIGQEVELFEAAYAARLPAMLKGPTGCGKTRFVEYMAHRLNRPLITVACHEDLSSTDLVGRFLLEGEETVWHDGPLTSAVRAGAICYLDEVVEARKDTVVIIHPLTDDRRRLPIEKRGTVLDAPDEFMLVVSYNPGYQSILKDLKQSTRQRFVAMEFDYPDAESETEIVAKEGGIDTSVAADLVKIGQKVRNLRGHGLEEGVSTRLLIYAAQMIAKGISPVAAAEVAICSPITDDRELQRSIREIVTTII